MLTVFIVNDVIFSNDIIFRMLVDKQAVLLSEGTKVTIYDVGTCV